MVLQSKAASDFYAACEELFARLDRECPLAISILWTKQGFAERSVILELADGLEREYFTVLQNLSITNQQPADYTMYPYGFMNHTMYVEPFGFGAKVDGSHRQLIPEFLNSMPVFLDALANGVPTPRNGSYFGVLCDGCVDTIIFSDDCTYNPPVTDWEVPALIQAQLQNGSAPNHPDLGWLNQKGGLRRLWEQYNNGEVILLDPFIAMANETAWWSMHDGIAYFVFCEKLGPIPLGIFHYYQPGRATPSLEFLLGKENKMDFASRVRNLLEMSGELQAV